MKFFDVQEYICAGGYVCGDSETGKIAQLLDRCGQYLDTLVLRGNVDYQKLDPFVMDRIVRNLLRRCPRVSTIEFNGLRMGPATFDHLLSRCSDSSSVLRSVAVIC